MVPPPTADSWGPLLEVLPQGVVRIDAEGHCVEPNGSACRILGRSREELLATGFFDPAWTVLDSAGVRIPPDRYPGVQVLRTRVPVGQVRVGLQQDDGDVQWLEVSAGPLADGGVLMTFDDVTERHRTEAILAARARIVERAAGSATLEEVLRSTLDEAELLTGSCIGFFHFVEPDQRTLSLQAWSTRTARDFCRAEGHGLHYPVDQAGVWTDALLALEPVIHNDYASLPHRRGLPEGHAEVLRELVVPVTRADLAVALLGVGNKPFPYGPSDVDQVRRLADLAWESAEHKRTQERHRLEEAALEHSLNAVVLADLEGRLRWVNPAFLRLWGLADRHAALGSHLGDFWADPGSVVAVLNRLVRDGDPVEGELKARRDDGTTFDAHFTASLAKDDAGRSLGVLGTFLDVTESRHLQAIVAENEDRFRRTFDQAPTAAAMAGLDGRLFRVNRAFCTFTGYTEAELQGLHFSDITHPEDLADGLAALRQLIGGGLGLYEANKRYLRKDGRVAWGRLNLSLIRGPGGEPQYFLPMIEDISARREAELALQESEARFNTAFQFMPVALGITRLAQRDFLAVNRAFTEIYGYTPEDLRGRTAGALEIWTDPADRDEVIRRLGAGEPVTDFEVRIRRKDGTLRTVSYSGEEVHIAGEACLLSAAVDITRRKEAEAALKLRSEELDAYFEQGVDLFVIAGTDGRFRRCNRAWQECLGYPVEELEGAAFLELVHPEDRPATQAAVATLAGQVPVVGFVNRYRHRDCSWRWLEWRSAANGDTIYAAARDVTSQKKAEAALRESEERYRMLSENAADVIWLLNLHTGRFEYVSPSVLQLRGLTPEEVMAQPLEAALTPAAAERVGELLAERIPAFRADSPGTSTFTDEVDQLRRDGTIVPTEVTTRFLADEEGRVTRILGVSRDITERRRSEAERRRLEQQLARTQRLESLGSLAGGVAHDMNNVLAAILSLAGLHQMQAPEGSPLRASMDTIAKACLRGRTLVQGLLGFARQDLAAAQVLDLNVLVGEEVSLLERTTLRRVELRLDLAPDLRPVKGDPAALSHALMNLCVNAVDAMAEGGTLTLRTRNEEGGRVRLEVVDTGAGMPAEVLEKALDPFFTTKPQGKGTGLGLPIVYGAVKAHHGQIELQSAPGLGTTAIIHLPSCAPAATQAAAGPQETPAGVSRRVLLVDDDDLIQLSAAQLLEALGHQVTVAGRGEEALARLETGETFDLMILDLNMPGLGGAATLPRVRALRADLPVLLATGRADQAALDLVASTAGVRLLAKPFALEDLRRELEREG